MVFPVGDDNSDRRTFPVVTVALLAANIFVFVVLQGMGQNDKVTLAYCQVPAEITSGHDIVTEPSVRRVSFQGQVVEVPVPGLEPTPIPVGLWFLFQVASGLFDQSAASGGGVAYSAHVAGFLAGMILAKPMSSREGRREADDLMVLRRRR